jgi:hypothetical protein
MPHQRQIIREAVQAALIGHTDAGTRVSETRMEPLKVSELPAVSVYSENEVVSPDSKNTAPRELARDLDLAVVGWVRATADVDDALDALALQIERVMHADSTFGGVASDSLLSSTETGIKVDGDRPMGAVKMVYTVRYYTYAPEAADTVLDDLKTVDVKYTVNGQTTPAEDTLLNLDQG